MSMKWKFYKAENQEPIMQIEDFKPTVPDQATSELIRAFHQVFGELAAGILGQVPPSAHRTDALRKLLESKMTLIHGITHPRD